MKERHEQPLHPIPEEAEKSKLAEIVDDFLGGKLDKDQYGEKLLAEFERRRQSMFESESDNQENGSKNGRGFFSRFRRSQHKNGK